MGEANIWHLNTTYVKAVKRKLSEDDVRNQVHQPAEGLRDRTYFFHSSSIQRAASKLYGKTRASYKKSDVALQECFGTTPLFHG